MTFCLFWVMNLIAISSGNEGKCYGDLGCFPITSDFIHPIYRPVNVDPQTPEEINTTFHLFTKKNPENDQLIDRHVEDTIKNSNYDSTKPSKFLIHGFTVGMDALMNITKEILRFHDVNIIMVDWSKGAQKDFRNPNIVYVYAQACSNTRVVGREIGNFMKILMENYQANSDDLHLIGHSLGAQIAGYAGQWMNNTKIGEITGLDPAGPFYQGLPPSVVLDSTDAKFVNTIHTNARPLPYTGFGTFELSGHVGFYPDGGKIVNECDDPTDVFKTPLSNVIKGARNFIACSHEKSIEMYKQSVNKKECPFTSYACEDIDSFREAKCYKCDKPGYDCRPMGYYTDLYPYDHLLIQKYFLTTTNEQPRLCAFHWIIEINFSDKQKAVSGDIYVSVVGEKYNLTNQKVNKGTENFSAGKTYNYLLIFEQNPVKILSLQLSWTRSLTEYINALLSRDIITLKTLTLIPIEIIDQQERREKTMKFCDKSLENIIPDKTITLSSQTEC